MPDTDETKGSSSESDDEALDDSEDPSSQTDAGADQSTDDEDDSEISQRTQKRIQTLLKARKAAETERDKVRENLSWYQQEIGSPDDVLAYKEWRKAKDAADAESKKQKESAVADTSPEKIKAIRDLVLTAVPELRENFSEKKMREEAIWDQAEREVRSIAKDAGYGNEEKFLRRLGQNIMLEINSDEKLLRRFRAGDMTALREAHESIESDYHGRLKGSLAKTAKEIETKRKASRLPTPPAGSTTVSHRPKPKKGQGLDTPGLADEAYALIHQSE